MSPSTPPDPQQDEGDHSPSPSRRLTSAQREHRISALDRRRVRRLRSLRLPLRILMLLAIAATLVLAKSLLIPLVLAAFIALGLNPIVAALHRLFVPRPLGSLLVMIALAAALTGTVIGVSAPAAKWVREAPSIMHDASYKLRRMTRPLTKVSHAASESLASVSGQPAPRAKAPAPEAFSFDDVAAASPGIVVAVLTVGLLVFFFLSYGRDVAAHLVTAMPGFSYRRVSLRLIRGIQSEFSRYLLTVTLINCGLGALTALILWALGVPSPLLWGGLATLLNFMPYVGAVTTTLLLVMVGLLNFHTPLQALAPAACFALLAAVEGNVITPMIIGNRMRLSPLAILIWLLIWAWMWGITGALLAVPMLTCLKLITEGLPGWQWFARMVGR
ncbi:MAG TPA: AI-2E family transporter [Rhodanobacteraceae bacterium]|nr:AI-2E family transporter [Rhodanobacteraceae bacterium]